MHFDWFFHVLMIYALDKCISDVTIDKFCFFINKTNRFHVAMALYSYKSQRMSEHAKNIRITLICAFHSSATVASSLLHFYK